MFRALGVDPAGAEVGDEAGAALGPSRRQRSEDLSGSGAFWSFIAAGNFDAIAAGRVNSASV